MEGASCQAKKLCSFIGGDTVIDLTPLFLAVRWSHNWQSPSYMRGDDFQGQDDNNLKDCLFLFFFFLPESFAVAEESRVSNHSTITAFRFYYDQSVAMNLFHHVSKKLLFISKRMESDLKYAIKVLSSHAAQDATLLFGD